MESGLRVFASCAVGCGRGVRHSRTLAGGVLCRALLRWYLLVTYFVSAFHGGSWAFADRALWSAFFAGFYLILMNITNMTSTQ